LEIVDIKIYASYRTEIIAGASVLMNYFCWIPKHGAVGWYVFDHDTSCTHRGAVTNANARKDAGMRIYAHVASDLRATADERHARYLRKVTYANIMPNNRKRAHHYKVAD